MSGYGVSDFVGICIFEIYESIWREEDRWKLGTKKKGNLGILNDNSNEDDEGEFLLRTPCSRLKKMRKEEERGKYQDKFVELKKIRFISILGERERKRGENENATT